MGFVNGFSFLFEMFPALEDGALDLGAAQKARNFGKARENSAGRQKWQWFNVNLG